MEVGWLIKLDDTGYLDDMGYMGYMGYMDDIYLMI